MNSNVALIPHNHYCLSCHIHNKACILPCITDDNLGNLSVEIGILGTIFVCAKNCEFCKGALNEC